MLDTLRDIETPEGVELGLRAAGLPVRAMAWIIDFLIRFGIDVALVVALTPLGRFGVGLMFIAVFLNEWFYNVLFEVLRDGATPGKRSMGIKVVHDDGTPVGWSASLVRNLLRVADFLPTCYAFGIETMLLHRDFKRLGDIAGGTLVVYADSLSAPPALPEVRPEPAPLALSGTEQHALVRFAERANTLTPERAEELADILEPLTGTRGETGIRRVLQYANYLIGRR
ncbi:MAG: RDD family protein [Gammaproteobacteria bacterium]